MESPLANPYSTPAANLYGTASVGGADAVAPSTIAQLAGTKPWIRFMSVIMWLVSGLLACLSFFYGAIAATGVFAKAMNSNPELARNPAFGSDYAKIMNYTMVGTAIYLGVFALLTVYPAIKLWKYANRIGSLTASHTTADLDAALNEQRRYWKFNGILVIIGICLVVIGVVAMFALIGTAAMKGNAFPR